jgi:hypothetical protein
MFLSSPFEIFRDSLFYVSILFLTYVSLYKLQQCNFFPHFQLYLSDATSNYNWPVTSHAARRNLNWDSTLFLQNVTHSSSGHKRLHSGLCWPRHPGVADPPGCTKLYILFLNRVAVYCARHRNIDVLIFHSNFVALRDSDIGMAPGAHTRDQNCLQNRK